MAGDRSLYLPSCVQPGWLEMGCLVWGRAQPGCFFVVFSWDNFTVGGALKGHAFRRAVEASNEAGFSR